MATYLFSVTLIVVLLAAACAPPAQPAGSADSTQAAALAGPKRIVAAIRGTPASIALQRTNRSVGSPPGLDSIEEMVHAGLVLADAKRNLHAQLAEGVPSIENGSWRVFPDGRMETIWRIKPAARWHDGAPVTAGDFALAATIDQDRELGIAPYSAYDAIESIETPDPQTIVVNWRQPYIEADAMFSHTVGLPLPRHLLEGPLAEDKAGFFAIDYWTHGFVGAGPFTVREWAVDSHVVLRAFDGYVLGRPKIDEVEVRFIADPNTLAANLLAGAIELTLGRTLIPAEQAQQVLEQWREGTIAASIRGWFPIHSQFVNTSPPVVTDVRFRRAMLHALDRQQMADTFTLGQSSIAHTWLDPNSEEHRDVEGSITRYDYDPRRSVQMIEGLGYTRGPDGVFQDASGQKLSVSIYTTIRSEIQPKITLAIADYWQRVGVGVEPVFVPIQRIGDREYRAQFPAFEMISGAPSPMPEDVRRFHSASTPLPENRFQITGNNARYRSPELDSFIDRYITTVPKTERMQALAQIVRHQTDQLPNMGLFYEIDSTLIGARLVGVGPRSARSSQAWNSHEWDIRR